MNKVFWIVGACVATAVVVTGGIGIKNGWFTNKDQTGNSQKVALSSPCQPKKVDIEGYGDKGEQLKNCFIEYPGEPTRKDKSYYIVEDICGQFTQSFMENMSGLDFIAVSKPIIQSLYNCTYFTETEDNLTGEYILVQLEYLSAENQKKGHELLGRTVTSNTNIPMANYLVYQEDGLINSILLILSDNKYIRVDRSSTTISDDILLNTATNIANEIKGYK